MAGDSQAAGRVWMEVTKRNLVRGSEWEILPKTGQAKATAGQSPVREAVLAGAGASLSDLDPGPPHACPPILGRGPGRGPAETQSRCVLVTASCHSHRGPRRVARPLLEPGALLWPLLMAGAQHGCLSERHRSPAPL